MKCFTDASTLVEANKPDKDWMEIKTQRILRPVFQSFLEDLSAPGKAFHGINVVFDGVKNAFSIGHKLPVDTISSVKQMEIEGCEEEYRMTFQYTDHEMIWDITPGNHMERDAIQALEVAFGHSASQTMISRRQDHFKRDVPGKDSLAIDLGLNLELRMGVRKSVKATEVGYVVNVDQAAAVFEKGGNAVAIFCNILNTTQREMNPLQFRMTREYQDLLQRELKGFRVNVVNPKVAYKRKYRIDAVTQTAVKDERFFWEEKGHEVSIKEYYEQHYGLQLKYPNMPCIQTQNRAKIPIEICEMIPEQYYAKKLSDRIQGQVTRRTIRTPNERMSAIQTGVEELVKATKRNVNCDVSLHPMEVSARILRPPSMHLNGRRIDIASPLSPREGGNPCDYSMRGTNLHETVELKKWVMIQVLMKRGNRQPNPDDALCMKFAGLLSNKAHQLGWKIHSKPVVLSTVYKETKMLEAFMMKAQKEHYAQMLFMFMPNGPMIYEDIKTIGNRQSIITQCLQINLDDNIQKEGKWRKMQGQTFCENMILKMNAKLGGVNAVLDPSTFKHPGKDDFLNKKGIMIMGIDVAHPGVGSTIKHSVAGFVGSYTSDYTKYFSQAKCQLKERQEVIQEWIKSVEEVSKDFFKEYSKKNKGQFPHIVVVYRDGVSEGQFIQVRDHEVHQLQKAMKSIKEMAKTKLVYITVQKRHHFRMFTREQGTGYSNVKPGTVIDTYVVNPGRFECYLNSHHALQGAARSSHYCVIYNDCPEMEHDLMETMSYYLCFLCARCPKPISLPIPVRYAHLVCEKASMYLQTHDRVVGNPELFESRVNDYVRIAAPLSDKLFFA